ncbi:hypothetical protein NDU88_008014 [Pleurodeles waltl]|uniref:Uncharacterized protein n=1 Tax=Pleurodeles waltl TaxID=8319 RepID=A0AAV7VV49_PLEWA|nr:hypothetical protein NDU88_008014 [Pleurodeles waltl]
MERWPRLPSQRAAGLPEARRRVPADPAAPQISAGRSPDQMQGSPLGCGPRVPAPRGVQSGSSLPEPETVHGPSSATRGVRVPASSPM